MYFSFISLNKEQKMALKEIEKLPYTADNKEKAIQLLEKYGIEEYKAIEMGESGVWPILLFSISSIIVGISYGVMFPHSAFPAFLMGTGMLLFFFFCIESLPPASSSNKPIIGHKFLKKLAKEESQKEQLLEKQKTSETLLEMKNFLGIKEEKQEKNILIERIQNKYIPELMASFNCLDKDIQEEKANELNNAMALFTARIEEIKNASKEEQREMFDREISLAEKKASITS